MAEQPEPSKEQWLAIQETLAAGQMIQAIKLYRDITGLGLKEAKDAMEAYYLKLSAEAPDRFPARAKSGCGSMVLLGAILLFAVAWVGIAQFWA